MDIIIFIIKLKNQVVQNCTKKSSVQFLQHDCVSSVLKFSKFSQQIRFSAVFIYQNVGRSHRNLYLGDEQKNSSSPQYKWEDKTNRNNSGT